MKTRTVRDSMGELEVPAHALWGAQTQRAVDNFAISGQRLPRRFIEALIHMKACAAQANAELKLLPNKIAGAIEKAAMQLLDSDFLEQFPIDVYQTGSGTSTNMNANEVLAELASRALQKPVHPNDHVNMGQSSNDTIPTAIHVSATLAVENTLLPALGSLRDTIVARGAAAGDTIKTGRTHLMDAMPIRIDQEMGAWAFQIEQDIERLQGTLPRLRLLAQGGTAIGSGINCHPEFAARFCKRLSTRVNSSFQPSGNFFAALAGQETSAELSGQMQVTATTLTKIANDLRLMNSGPLAGLQEIALPALQPGSSIMPGKINPVIPEAVTMVAARVAGNQTTIALAAQSGNFQLNVMLPVIANALLESIELLANSATALADKAIKGLTINDAVLTKTLASNPILVTALNAKIGYELGAEIAKIAYAEGRSVLEVAKEKTDLDEDELQRLLDPRHLTGG